MMYRATKTDSLYGIFIACTILLLWGGHLAYILIATDVHSVHPYITFAHILVQTFLYTGLFITAHDAMHGAVCRHYRRLNTALGVVAVRFYALFSYTKLWHKHWEHHRHVATPHADPDFHDGKHQGFVRWYAHFLGNYIGWKQIAGMAIVFNILLHLCHIPAENLLLFWVAPALASTVQLFFFGTYLPHREPKDGYTNQHRSTSQNVGTALSFLSCYHFGYHYEHHEFPSVPWWRLPRIHRAFTQPDQQQNQMPMPIENYTLQASPLHQEPRQ